MRPTIKFKANEPVELSLQYPTGRIVTGFNGDQSMFSLCYPADHVMFLDLELANRIALQHLQPGEHFFLCKRPKNGSVPSRWDIWLSPTTEQLRAQKEMASRAAESELEQDLENSILQARMRRPVQPAPPSMSPATGTHGPVPVAAPRTMPAERAKTKLEDALKTVVAAVYVAQEYAKQIGFAAMPQFSAEDIRTMANTLIIDSQRNGGPHA